MGWKWMRWGTMEEAGGLQDQPAGLVDRVTAAMNVYEAFKSYLANQGTKDDPERLVRWTKVSPGQMKIVAMVQRMRDGKDA